MTVRRQRRARQVRREERALPSYAGRRYAVLGLFALAGVVLMWRAVDQQILEKDFLQSAGAHRYLTEVKVPAHRGLITDRRGEVLAMSTPVLSVSVNPRVIGSDTAQIVALAKVLEMDAGQLVDRLARYSQRLSIPVRRRLAPARAEHAMNLVKARGIPGVHLKHEYKRYYPAGEVFAHVLGFTDIDDVGQEGIELAFDGALRGESGQKQVLRDGLRQVVDDVKNIRSPRAGDDLRLSIDQRLQFIAYRELKAAVKRHRAIAGSLVLLDTRSGEILAMANQPSFNPNGDRSNQGGKLRNRALTDVFEPGSTTKPFTVATALDLGMIQIDSQIDTTPGYFRVGAAQVRDSKDLGLIDVATILRKSSNVGAGKIALGLDKRELWRVMDGLGFGRSTQTGFPGEASGQLSDYRGWARIDQATLAFGYGLSVTTLQLARAYAVLANDGVLLPTTLIKRDVAPPGRRVFSASTAVAVRHMLEDVVSAQGTAPQAALLGYRVAGKTGTVKKFGPDGYNSDRYLSLFAGIAPARDPRIVMVVVLDEPRAGKYYGGQVAGPVFAAVGAEALRLLNVAPDAAVDPGVRLAQTGETR